MCKRLKECSRHREKYPVPKTPEHFWSLDFPNNNDDHRNRGNNLSMKFR